MTLDRAITELAELKARLAKAEIERDTWRASGRQENYLAAYSMVEALELQIEQLERAARAAAASAPITAERFTNAIDYARLDRSRPFGDLGVDDSAQLDSLLIPTGAEREVMRALDITFVDGVFHWREYRYDRLADAVAYARRR